MKILVELKGKVDKDNIEMKNELLGLADKVNVVKAQVASKDERDKRRMRRMDQRITKLEEAMEKTINQTER